MNIVLVGYGRMGHEIEEAARKRGHTISLVVDVDNKADLNSDKMKKADVVIEFTLPEAAFENISACLKMKIPVVSGTTGWLKDYDRARELCLENGTSFLHSSNFSIAVNLLYRLSSELAGYMKNYNEYTVSIEEIHHVKKLDAPSGTAIALAEGIAERHPGYAAGWCPDQQRKDGMIPVKSVREGLVPGIHIVEWDSDIDTISLRHEARNRKGLALGAVVAAEFISNRKGVFTMSDVLGF
jgi:4-hydroxy-tetrahydrodipicolinate reductase